MLNSVEDVRDQALRLSAADRANLARDLLLSLESEPLDDDCDAAWEVELEARASAVAAGKHSVSDWREAVARVRDSLAARQVP